MTYRLGGLIRKAPTHDELLAEHHELVLSEAAGHTIETFNLHFGGTLDGVDAFLRQPMSFSVVVHAVSPAFAPEIGFIDDFRPSARERVQIVNRVQLGMAEMYPSEDEDLVTMAEANSAVNDSEKVARAILDLANGVSSTREARSLSVEALAVCVGLDVADIEMLEEGDVSDLSLLLKVVDALDADVHLEGGFRVSVSVKVAT